MISLDVLARLVGGRRFEIDDAPIPRSAIALRDARLCADCETIFDGAAAACPACTSTTWHSLARLLYREPKPAVAVLAFPPLGARRAVSRQ